VVLDPETPDGILTDNESLDTMDDDEGFQGDEYEWDLTIPMAPRRKGEQETSLSSKFYCT
jgi:hypothetical protein